MALQKKKTNLAQEGKYAGDLGKRWSDVSSVRSYEKRGVGSLKKKEKEGRKRRNRTRGGDQKLIYNGLPGMGDLLKVWH